MTGRAAIINSTELRDLLHTSAPPLVIDVRTPGEFETAHIAAAALADSCARGMALSKLPYNRAAACDAQTVVSPLVSARVGGSKKAG